MPMDDRHAALTQTLINSVLTQEGEVTPQLRTQINEYVVQLRRSPGADGSELPAELSSYINKVALHAYKVTDEDIAALLQAGYSEDAIFEITVSIALGAGMDRLQRGLAALKGVRHASQAN